MNQSNVIKRSVVCIVFGILLLQFIQCSINPSRPDVKAIRFFNDGVAALETEEQDQALANFYTAIELDPSLWQAYENAGLIFAKKERYDKAIELFKQGLYADPDNVKLHFNIGLCFYRMGEHDKAYTYFEKINELDPTYQYGKNNYLHMQYLEETLEETHPVIVLPDEQSYLVDWDIDASSHLILVKNLPTSYPSEQAEQLGEHLINLFLNPFLHNLAQQNLNILNGDYLFTGMLEDEITNLYNYIETLEEPTKSVILIIMCPEEQISETTYAFGSDVGNRKLEEPKIMLTKNTEDELVLDISPWIQKFREKEIQFYFALLPLHNEADTASEAIEDTTETDENAETT